MTAPHTYTEAIEALAEAFGQPWTGTDRQARFDIKTGIKHTAVDLFETVDGLALVSVHTLPPYHFAGFDQDHAEFVAGLLRGVQFKQWPHLPGPLARRHYPAPAPDLTQSGD